MNVQLTTTNSELRNADTLELLGHWFQVDNSIYFIPLHNLN